VVSDKVDNALLAAGLVITLTGILSSDTWLMLLGGFVLFVNILTRVIVSDRRRRR
jgi:hypothetical protein